MTHVAGSVYNSPMHKERIEGVIASAYDTITSLERENRSFPFKILAIALVSTVSGLAISAISTPFAIFFAGGATYHLFSGILELRANAFENRLRINKAKEVLDDCQQLTDVEVCELRGLASQKSHSKDYFDSIMQSRGFVLRGEAKIIKEFIALPTTGR